MTKGKSKAVKITVYLVIMVVMSFIRALATYVFIVPNAFAPGGVSGVASIIYNIVALNNLRLANTIFNPAVTVFVLNVPIFICSFIYLDKKFTLNTIFCVTVYSLFMGLFSMVDFPVFAASNYESGIMILASIAGGALCGVSLGFLLKVNTCMGGTDTIAKIVYKKNPIIDVQWIIFVCDCIVVLLSGLIGILNIKGGDSNTDIMVKILAPVLYSFISLFATSKVADIIHIGMQSSLVANIVTDKPKEVGELVTGTLRRGASLISAEGVYTHQQHSIVICVVRKKQLVTLKKLIKSVDPNAFIYINEAREVRGKGFTSPLNDNDTNYIDLNGDNE